MSNKRAFFATQHPRVIGHRGAAGVAPENTMVSFQLGVESGADILEMDVHLTKDGYVVVCHDATVDRTTNGTGRIADMTLAELRALDAGYRFSAAGHYPFRDKGIIIPLFEEVLRAFPQMPINVEPKDDCPDLRQAFVALLEKFGRLDGSVVVSGFKHKALRPVRRLMPASQMTSASTFEISIFVIARRLRALPLLRPLTLKRNKALQVPVRKNGIEIVTPLTVNYAHKLGIEVHVWTVNDVDEMRRLLKMGVDALFTDQPAVMRKLVDKEFANTE